MTLCAKTFSPRAFLTNVFCSNTLPSLKETLPILLLKWRIVFFLQRARRSILIYYIAIYHYTKISKIAITIDIPLI